MVKGTRNKLNLVHPLLSNTYAFHLMRELLRDAKRENQETEHLCDTKCFLAVEDPEISNPM
jgi:hypothetical protein